MSQPAEPSAWATSSSSTATRSTTVWSSAAPQAPGASRRAVRTGPRSAHRPEPHAAGGRPSISVPSAPSPTRATIAESGAVAPALHLLERRGRQHPAGHAAPLSEVRSVALTPKSATSVALLKTILSLRYGRDIEYFASCCDRRRRPGRRWTRCCSSATRRLEAMYFPRRGHAPLRPGRPLAGMDRAAHGVRGVGARGSSSCAARRRSCGREDELVALHGLRPRALRPRWSSRPWACRASTGLAAPLLPACCTTASRPSTRPGFAASIELAFQAGEICRGAGTAVHGRATGVTPVGDAAWGGVTRRSAIADADWSSGYVPARG